MSATWSRPFQVAEGRPCGVLHPWTDSCLLNALGIGLRSFKGSTNFFLLLHLLPLLLRLRSGTSKDDVIHQLVSYFRSCLFGSFCGGVSIGMVCLLRYIRGKHSIIQLGFVPGMLGAAGIFLEHPSRRTLDTTLLISLVMDLYVKVLLSAGVINMTLWKELAIFSSSSTLLLYCLRVFPHSFSVMWPFPPHKLPPDPDQRRRCPHTGDCVTSISTAGKTCFCYGLVLQIIKAAVLNFHQLFSKPLLFVKALTKLDNLRLPLFAGIYSSIFKGVSCSLVRRRGRDEAWHCLPAGAIASLCYLIQPNFTLSLISLGNVYQVICRRYKEDSKLPNFPWEELTFMVCMGLLYHARAVYPQCFPRFMLKIMDTVTDGRAEIVYGLVEKHLKIRAIENNY